jgi:hypothetical protein
VLRASTIVVLFVGACASDTDFCDPATATCVEPTWASIHGAVITPSCAVAFCHGDPDGRNEGELDLRGVAESYALLPEVSTTTECGPLGLRLVEAGDPERSLLYRKLFETSALDDRAICGFRMPYAGSPLPDAYRDAIRAWIEDGAPGPE